MFNETKIRENQVCYLDGKRDGLRDLLYYMERKGRKTLRFREIEGLFLLNDMKYKKHWDDWADANKLGGTRFRDEEG